jgi:hypothetical protein
LTDTPGFIELEDVVADEDAEERVVDDLCHMLSSQRNRIQEGLTVETIELVDAGGRLLEDWAPAATLHCRTTCTRGSPFDPVTGVNVMVHDSVTGPASLQQHRKMNQYKKGSSKRTRKTDVLTVCTV